jgi:rhodanese-related sulfurtransferase
MKMNRRHLALMGVFFLATALGSCQNSTEPEKSKSALGEIQNQISAVIPVQEFQQKLKNDHAQLLDVRTPGEFGGGYIAGAQNVDISQWGSFEAAISKLDKAEPVMVYCAVGGRSKQAATYLEQQGFNEIYDLEGGIKAWISASGEIVNQ